MGIRVSFVYFMVPFLHRARLWVERLGMPCNAERARKLSRQYVCSLRFSRTYHIGWWNKSGKIGSSKSLYSDLTLQFSPTSISV